MLDFIKIIKVEKNIYQLIFKLNNVITILKSRNKDKCIEVLSSCILCFICQIKKFDKIYFFTTKRKNIFRCLCMDIEEIKEYLDEMLFEIKSDDKGELYYEYLAKHINENNDVYLSNIIFIEDYIDNLLIDLYPYFTLKSKRRYLRFIKNIQKNQ